MLSLHQRQVERFTICTDVKKQNMPHLLDIHCLYQSGNCEYFYFCSVYCCWMSRCYGTSLCIRPIFPVYICFLQSWTMQHLRLDQNKSMCVILFVCFKVFLELWTNVARTNHIYFFTSVINHITLAALFTSVICFLTTSRLPGRTKRSTFHTQKYTKSLIFDNGANFFAK